MKYCYSIKDVFLFQSLDIYQTQGKLRTAIHSQILSRIDLLKLQSQIRN